MSIYDIMGEIAAKQVMKTETGDNLIPGLMTGIVVKNYDRDMPGRVCIKILERDENENKNEKANKLQWARVSMLYGGDKGGHYFLPEVGDQVLLGFLKGNIEEPLVIGSVFKDNSSFLRQSVDEKNQFKKIVTKNGGGILIKDSAEGEGKKDQISVYTPDKAHQMILDNENHKILLSDKEGKNKVELKTETGQMVIKAEKKLTIQVGDNIEVILNGSSGAVSIKCSKLQVEASGSVKMESNSSFKISGGSISMEASSALKASSSGLASLTGSPIKIG